MYDKEFDDFFDNSIPKLTNQSNIELLKNKIDELDEKYSSDMLTHSTFFGSMIKSFRKYNLPGNIITYFITNWNGIYEIDDLIIVMITNFNCDPDDMKYIIETIDVPDYNYIIEYIIQHKDKMLFSIMYENINYCFAKKLTHNLIEKQISLAMLYDNDTVKNYLEMKQKQIDDFKQKPTYVSVQEGENRAMLDTVDQGKDQTKIQLRDDLSTFSDKYIKSLSFNKDKSNFDINKALNIFMATRSQCLTSDKNHVDIRNRLWGPMNAIRNTNCYYNKNNIGPCRMLQCECKEEESESWFNGTCNVCGSKIRNKSYAVRFPLEEGGWFGCYCSFRCMTDKPPIKITNDTDILINYTKDVLKTDGIFDRISG